jgi:hypothetical protein
VSDELTREALDDAESVTLTVIGRNGHKFEYRINSHERTSLELAMGHDQERMPELSAHERIWAPSWRSATFTVTSRFSYRAEDFLPILR